MLTSLGGSPYLLLARVGRLLMCMVVAVCDGNEGLAAIKNNPDIAMVITDMRYCAGGIVRLVVWPLWLCVIVVSNEVSISAFDASRNPLISVLIRLVSFIIFIGRFHS